MTLVNSSACSRQMNDSERFGKLRSSFALAQGWKRKKKKKPSLFHQGHRTSAIELLHKERDGHSKAGRGGPGVNQQAVNSSMWTGAGFLGKRQNKDFHGGSLRGQAEVVRLLLREAHLEA